MYSYSKSLLRRLLDNLPHLPEFGFVDENVRDDVHEVRRRLARAARGAARRRGLLARELLEEAHRRRPFVRNPRRLRQSDARGILT